jgi:5-methylthioadenosine/S-adenosylhomocysteine deaminase
MKAPTVNAAGEAPAVCDMLIHNGYVITMDPERRVYRSGAVAIAGTDIVAVGPEAEIAPRFRALRELDAASAIVHPGLIDAHYHATLHATRGALPDAPDAAPAPSGISDFSRWLNALTDEDEYASALHASLEFLKNGTTCFMEGGTAFEPDAVAQAARAAGIRVSVTDPYVWDLDSEVAMARELPRVPATSARAHATLGKQLWRNADARDTVHAHVALYGNATASDELSLAAKACADAHHTVLCQHQSFEHEDVEADDRRLGRHPLLHFAEIGLLGSNCSFVHMNIIRDDEIAAVISSGMSLIWHPGNFLYYGIGTQHPCRMPHFLSAGVPIAFGTDVAKAWTMGENGWLAYISTRGDGKFIAAEEILEIQTLGGSRALGLSDRIGSIEPGKRADIVIRRNDLPECQPGLSPIHDMVLINRSKSVDTVLVNGVVVLRGGISTLIDEAVVYQRARESARNLLGRTGFSVAHRWNHIG